MQATVSNIRKGKITSVANEVTVFFAAGGSLQKALESAKIVHADIVIYVDMPSEFQKRLNLPQSVIQIPLAVGDSVNSCIMPYINDRRFKDVCEVLHTLSGDMHDGAGQISALSRMAIETVNIRDGHLDPVLVLVMKLINDMTNAAPQRIKFIKGKSRSGGTGSGVVDYVGNAFVHRMVAETNATISVLDLSLGAVTFNGLGDFIEPNNAQGVVTDLVHVLDPDTALKETRRLVGFELPMYEEDRTLRDRAMIATIKAFMAELTQNLINAKDSNKRMSNPFNRILTVKSGFWFMSNSVNLEASAALLLMPELASLLSDASLGVAPVISLAEAIEVVKNEAHETLVNMMKSPTAIRSADMMIEMVDARVSGSITVTSDEHTGSASVVQSIISLPTPETLADFMALVRRLKTLRKALQAKRDEIAKEDIRYKREWQGVRDQIENLINLRWPQPITDLESLWVFIQSKWQNKVKLSMQLKQKLSVLPEYERKKEVAGKKLSALDEALVSINEKIEFLMSRLTTMQSWLHELSRKQGAIAEIFTSLGIETVFQDMLLDIQTGSKKRFEMSIQSAIGNLTLAGLQLLVGAKDKTALSIIQTIMAGPREESPWWGGLERNGDDHRSIVVLPPVADDVFMELDMTRKTLKAKFQLSEQETVVGGISLVQLDVYYVDTIEQYRTKMYVAAYQKLMDDPAQQLFSVLPESPDEKKLMALVKRITSRQSKRIVKK